MVCRLSLSVTIMALVAGGAALASPITDTAKTYVPLSTTAAAITGALKISRTRIVFENGTSVAWHEIAKAAPGLWDLVSDVPVNAQIFRLSGDPGPLLRGNSLCGDGFAASHVTVHLSPSAFAEPDMITVTVFGGDGRPEAARSDNLCGTFNYLPE